MSGEHLESSINSNLAELYQELNILHAEIDKAIPSLSVKIEPPPLEELEIVMVGRCLKS